jgi:hypothetical protein
MSVIIEEPERQRYDYGYRSKYRYPLFKNIRIFHKNLDRLKKRASYGQSIDDVITIVLNRLEDFEQ